MKTIALAVAAFAVVVAASALGASSATVSSKHNSKLGTIVIGPGGFTVYHLTGEKPGGSVKCTGACAALWPAVVVPKGAKAKAGAGIVQSKLGVAKRPDGKWQVTYRGLRLYRYSGDPNAGATNGEGISEGSSGTWYALHPSGSLAKPAAQSSSSGGGGYGYP